MIHTLRRIWSRILGSFSSEQRDRELAEELDYNIRLLTEANIVRGYPPEEAYRLARLEFGSVEAVKESYRDQRGLPVFNGFGQDLRYALRGIRKSPGFAALTIFLLALGIGANATLFSIVNAVLLRPLPYPESDRLVWVGATRADLPFSSANPGAASYDDFLEWRKQQTVFERIGAYQPTGGSPGAFLIDGQPVRMEIQRMSADAFAALKVAPAIGRVYNNEEDRVRGTPSVVLSYQTWQERFGGAAVVGKTVTMNSVVHQILGVMPPGFSFPYKGIEAWLPLGPMPVPPRATHYLGAIARLKPGVTVEQARAEMAGIAAGLEQAFPDANKGWKGHVEPMMNVVIGDTGRPLWVLFGAVCVVLLIACANVANILLARASARQLEMSLKAALGASRGRIVRQLVAESLMLSCAGAVLALLLARTGLAVFVALAGNAIPRSAEIRLDGSVFAFAAVLAVVTGIVFGLAPAWMNSRTPLRESLQAGGRGSSGQGGRARQALIVAEVALTVLLLTGAGLLLRSFQRLHAVDQGFSGERVVSFDLWLPGVKYRTPALQNQFFDSLIEQLRTLPGVEDVGMTSRLPLKQRSGDIVPYAVEGQTRAPDRPLDSMQSIVVSPGYFKTMGIHLLRGRLFTDQDDAKTDRVIVVDEEFAKRHFAGEDPVGRRVRVGGVVGGDDAPYATVVGVVARVKLGSLGERGGFVQGYVPWSQRAGINASFVLKGQLTPAALAVSIREQVRALDPAQPIHNLRTITEVRDSSLASERLNLSVLGVFALVALTLSVVGLYGVLAYSVARRQREIGVRTALGARPADVLTLVMGQGMRLIALGVVLGLAASLWMTRWLTSLLFEIKPIDPATFSAVALLLIAVALLASWIPARRAARIDPIQALREQ
jgi:putative ABC transport system permease protein